MRNWNVSSYPGNGTSSSYPLRWEPRMNVNGREFGGHCFGYQVFATYVKHFGATTIELLSFFISVHSRLFAVGVFDE
jgi:hypothetical protein